MEKKEETSGSSSRPLSITAPPPAANLPPAANQPRQPSSVKDVMRYAFEADPSLSVQNIAGQNLQPMDEEKKKFLSEAIDSLALNVIEELQKALKKLKNVMELREEDDPSEYESALECIASYVDNMDTANDFYKIGGFGILGACLNSPHASIRWSAANLIAELTQNNQFCQDKIMQMGLIPILLGMVDTDPSEQARIKSLYALSCVIRGNKLAQKYMDINDGYSVLVRAMQSSVDKLQIKSAFLLSSLCSEESAHSLRSTLIKMGLIQQTAGLLALNNILHDTRDALLRILNSLTENNNLPALLECRKPEFNLREVLKRLRKDLQDEKAVDEISLCNELLNKIFADDSSFANQDR